MDNLYRYLMFSLLVTILSACGSGSVDDDVSTGGEINTQIAITAAQDAMKAAEDAQKAEDTAASASTIVEAQNAADTATAAAAIAVTEAAEAEDASQAAVASDERFSAAAVRAATRATIASEAAMESALAAQEYVTQLLQVPVQVAAAEEAAEAAEDLQAIAEAATSRNEAQAAQFDINAQVSIAEQALQIATIADDAEALAAIEDSFSRIRVAATEASAAVEALAVINLANAEIEAGNADAAAISAAAAAMTAQDAETTVEAQSALDDAKDSLEDANATLTALEAILEDSTPDSITIQDYISDAESSVADAEGSVTAAENALSTLVAAEGEGEGEGSVTAETLASIREDATEAMAAVAASGGGSSGPTAEEIASGANVFIENCAVCHGAEGDGGNIYPASLFPLLDTYSHSSDANTELELADYIAAYMPPPGSLLSESEVSDVTAYLMSLGGTDSATDIYDGDWSFSPSCKDETYVDANGRTVIGSTLSYLVVDGTSAGLAVYNYTRAADCTGINQKVIAELALDYGDEATNASSICKAQELDIEPGRVTANGFPLSGDNVVSVVENNLLPILDLYGLICISEDGTRLYGGDFDDNTGATETTRPSVIDDELYFTKQQAPSFR